MDEDNEEYTLKMQNKILKTISKDITYWWKGLPFCEWDVIGTWLLLKKKHFIMKSIFHFGTTIRIYHELMKN
jgi:hypothetical protein